MIKLDGINKGELFKTFGSNFIKGGLLIGLTVTIIEFIYKSNDLISFFAYASASLFIVQLFQYYYVNYKNSKVIDKFLFHSFVGGSVWVLFIIIMILLHKYTNNINLVVISCISLYILGLIIYFILLKNTKLNQCSI
tara:strand:- start:400 stop:810 length:411 start_codon:yes stop_codon:yes gene_type:complete